VKISSRLIRGFWLAMLFLAPAVRAQAPGKADFGPSVLFLAIDTLRGDHLHCLGADSLQTPHLDALAQDGVLFRRAMSAAPWTLPSFASVYTGLVPYRHGTIGGRWRRLAEEQVTLAELLAEAGYSTAAYVTVPYVGRKYGLGQGFQELSVLEERTERGAQAAEVTRHGCEYLAAHRDSPFFLLLHYFDVHAPYTPPAPYDRMYYDGDERASGEPILPFLLSGANQTPKKPGMYDWLAGVSDLQFGVRQYAAGVSFVDDQLGQVLACLQELGLYDKTLVVLLSDHGEHLGEHDIWFAHFLPYGECLHVPLILKLPGAERAGTVVDTPVSNLDLLPTVLDLLRLPIPRGLDGRSLTGLLAGGTAGASLLVAEQGTIPGRYSKALVEWPWKLLLIQSGNQANYFLFNLAADPAETRDLAGEQPEMVEHLRTRLWQLFDPAQPLVAEPEERPVELDEATQRRLRALGYVN
jgi:arylsulfatase A-like enzyme